MRKLKIVATLLALALTSCSSAGPMSSPTATFKTQHKAALDKDVVTYRNTFASFINKKLEEFVKQTKFNSLDEYYKDELDKMNVSPTYPEFRNEKIDGDRATLEFRYPGGEWQTDYYVKEGEEWKTTFMIPKSYATPSSTPDTTPLSSPTAAYKAQYEAWQRQDIANYKRALSTHSLQRLGEIAKEKNTDIDTLLKSVMGNSPHPYGMETRNEKIKGDTATLEAKEENGKWNVIPFAKENGDWKWGQ